MLRCAPTPRSHPFSVCDRFLFVRYSSDTQNCHGFLSDWQSAVFGQAARLHAEANIGVTLKERIYA